jgi:hypothetical protein
MAISRMQQPRQMYGLGSLVKKAITKGITGAVKGVVDVAKSPLGISCNLLAFGRLLVLLHFIGQSAGFGNIWQFNKRFWYYLKALPAAKRFFRW